MIATTFLVDVEIWGERAKRAVLQRLADESVMQRREGTEPPRLVIIEWVDITELSDRPGDADMQCKSAMRFRHVGFLYSENDEDIRIYSASRTNYNDDDTEYVGAFVLPRGCVLSMVEVPYGNGSQ